MPSGPASGDDASEKVKETAKVAQAFSAIKVPSKFCWAGAWETRVPELVILASFRSNKGRRDGVERCSDLFLQAATLKAGAQKNAFRKWLQRRFPLEKLWLFL
jgi:hypothetical protein